MPETNMIERAIAFASPEWAVRRAAAREILNAHRGGLGTRTGNPFSRSYSYSGGTASERRNQASRRDRARKTYKENPIGRTLLKTEVDNVVSSGFILQSKTASDEFNREAEARWVDWLNVADIRGMFSGVDLQRQFYRSPRRDGDGGVVLVDRGGESRLQYIPGDLISSPPKAAGAVNVFDGVEVNEVSRPIAFHIRSINEHGKDEWTRVSANNFVYLAPEIDDDLSLRGDSCYSQIFPLLDQIDGYIDAVTIAARMACVFGLIFKESTAAKQFGQLGALTNAKGEQQKALTIENGMAKYIGKDDDVVQVQAQQPMNQTPDFIRAILRLIGLPFDMPLELVAKDMSQVNFASARIGLIGYYRACRARQKAFRVRCLSRIYQWWIAREIKMGRFVSAVPADGWAHEFMAEGWDYTDPVSEAQADLLQIDMGIKTRKMAAAERGRDWEEMQIQLKAETAARKLNELPDVAGNYTRDRLPQQDQQPAQPQPQTQDGDDDGE
jgi:lambda family phage portal protein